MNPFAPSGVRSGSPEKDRAVCFHETNCLAIGWLPGQVNGSIRKYNRHLLLIGGPKKENVKNPR